MRPKLAAVLPLLVFLAHVAHEHRRLLLADVDARLVKAARHVAARHDQLVAGLEQTLTALRGARPLLGDDRAACHDRLADTVADDPRYSNMILIEEGGAVVCNARGAPLASVPADARPSWRSRSVSRSSARRGSRPGQACRSCRWRCGSARLPASRAACSPERCAWTGWASISARANCLAGPSSR
jgi:hypothetical protein